LYKKSFVTSHLFHRTPHTHMCVTTTLTFIWDTTCNFNVITMVHHLGLHVHHIFCIYLT